MSSLFSYIMRADTGFSPHVDLRCLYLSLACCKPGIRRSAKEDDWVLGIGGMELHKKSGTDMVGRLIYAAKVNQMLDFDSYFSNSSFNGRLDNIYRSVDGKGQEWIQAKNPHHSERHIEKDTSANRVLISDHFLYFGSEGPRIEDLGSQFLALLKKGPGHKKFDLERESVAKRFIESLEGKFDFHKCSTPTEAGRSAACDECEL